MSEVERGKIRKLKADYGFIQTSKYREQLFFHRTGLVGTDFHNLFVLDDVTFVRALDYQNKLRATVVRLARKKT